MRNFQHSLLWICITLFSLNGYGQITFTALTPGTIQNLRGISFADTNTGYVCGDTGVIIKTTDGGATWSALTTGTTADFWDIKVIPNTGGQKVVVVGDNSTILKSLDGGATWTAQSIPFSSGSFVFGVQCFDSLNYIACGGDGTTLSGAVLRTSDGGATWIETTVTASGFLDKISMLDMATGFAVGFDPTFPLATALLEYTF